MVPERIRQLLIFTRFHVILIFLLSLLFFTWNLDGQYYQLDESGTISQAEGIAAFGYPSGWDGQNLLSDMNGREYDLPHQRYFWTWQPPMQSLTAYLGGEVFGNTVFGYRFFFAAFGAGTVALFFMVTQLVFTKRWIGYLVTAQLFLCLPFFLYIRQVRYYAPSAFFTTIFLYLFVRAWKNQWGRQELLIMVISSSFLFFTNYFVWAGSVATLGLLLLWQRNKTAVVALMATGVIPVVWYVLFKPFAGDPTGAYTRDVSLLTQFLRYFPYIHTYLLPAFLLPLVFIRKTPLLFWALCGVIICKLAMNALFLETHGRYLVDIIPLIMLFYGFIYASLDSPKMRSLIPVIFILSVAIANPGAMFPKSFLGSPVQLRSAPQAYAVELTETYPTMFLPLADYLQRNYQVGDIFWSNNYRNTLYLTSDIPHLTPVCDLKTQKPLGPESVSTRENIRWFIFFQHDSRLPQTLDTVPCLGKEWQRILTRDYVRSTFTIPPGYYPVNDPDIVNRVYPPSAAASDQVIIYEKKHFFATKKHETLITKNPMLYK